MAAMRMEKRRCFSTSEAPYIKVDMVGSSDTDSDVTDGDVTDGEAAGESDGGEVLSGATDNDKEGNNFPSSSTDWNRALRMPKHKTRTVSETVYEDRILFSRRLSSTAERMIQTRKLVSSKSTGSIFGPGGRKSPPYLLLPTSAKDASSVSVASSGPCDSTKRRVSLIVDELRQPIAVVQSFQDKVSVQPLLRQPGSLSRLLENPYGLEEGPKVSMVPEFPRESHTRGFSKPCERHDLVYSGEFVKECQTKGEIVKKADYRLLNVTALFIIAVLIAAIVFFSLWRDVSGEIWVMYCGLAVFVVLVILALLAVRLHFCLKSRGYNLLCRQQGAAVSSPGVRTAPALEKIEEVSAVEKHSGEVQEC